MAGMLPGVEAARRRRVHQTSSSSNITTPACSAPSCRRLSFSLFSTPSSPSSFTQERRRAHHQADEKLGQVAREAKGRLDERLRAQRKTPLVTRSNGNGNSETSDERGRNEAVGGMVNIKELKREVYGSKKSGGGGGAKKLMGWTNKLGWKAGEQEECAVCLDEFKAGDTLFNLPCAHRFHDNCLRPWLHSNAHCPCCRVFIVS